MRHMAFKLLTEDKVRRVFILEFLTYLCYLLLFVGYSAALHSIGVDGAVLKLAFAFFTILLVLLLILVWLFSRYEVWRIITKKRLDHYHFTSFFLIGVPYGFVQLVALVALAYLSYLVLIPVVQLSSVVLRYIVAYALFGFFIYPLLFNIICYNNVAFYMYFKSGKLNAFFPKLKNFSDYEKSVLFVTFWFFLLTLLMVFVSYLPAQYNWIIMVFCLAFFFAWSKLYFVEVYSKK